MELTKRQKPRTRALKVLTIKLCIILLTTVVCVLPQSAAAASEDIKTGVVADATANITFDQKDRDRQSSVSPFPDNNKSVNASEGEINKNRSGGGDNQYANISTVSNNANAPKDQDTTTIKATTTTTTTTAAPLIPPATVSAAIAQMNSSQTSKMKGKIIIR